MRNLAQHPQPESNLLGYIRAGMIITAICAVLAGFGVGCKTTGEVTIPTAPTWIKPADAREFTAAEVAAEIRRLRPSVHIVGLSDRVYTPVSHRWLKSYVDWTWHVARIVGIKYTPESFDCENVARTFNDIASLKAAQAGVRAALLSAEITVQDSPTTRHALVGVSTDRGIVIVEPQPDAGPFRITPLADYPHQILAVELGLGSAP